jgi:3-methylcrotonyl-CoA carboxylase alpha subunit
VESADEAYAIGPAPARESYLDQARILEAARRCGAEAIHPGYGFLSENADFAAACAAAGLIFIGPPATAIRAMGDKAAAKALMEQAGVPVVPGYHGADQSDARLAAAARQIGYPVLIKAAAGGGGKGMRVVAEDGAFAAALAAARREAAAAFGDARMLIEKYLERPRHIEVQVFADTHGNVMHLFERDCSIQRRHQKIIEEAPAPGLSEARRQEIGAMAVAAARAVGYLGAGTIELIAAGDAFYFMEMNTRLQVEHAVTEMITGLDLVEWQIRVAAGEPLPLEGAQVPRRGHAIEARLYAEDPDRDFLPATGMIDGLRLPVPQERLRIDAGVRQGDGVTIHYDPLLAKLIAWGEDRAAAAQRLALGLAETRVAGVVTNRDFLLRVLRHPDFLEAPVDTGFIDRHRAALGAPAAAPPQALAAASLGVLQEQQKVAGAVSGDPHSPWHRRDGWRLNGDTYQDLRFAESGEEHVVRVRYRQGGYGLEIGETVASARLLDAGDERLVFDWGGERVDALFSRRGAVLTVALAEATYRLSHVDPGAAGEAERSAGGRLTAPMPGKVSDVLVRPGERVRRGQVLVVLEAMKMEHAIVAPAEGVVEAVHCAGGDVVAEGAELLSLGAAGA